MKQFPIPVLKECPCEGAFLFSLRVPSGFGGRAGSAVSTSHVFPQGVLAAITLVGSRAGDAEARAGAKCKSGLLLCSVASTTLMGVGAAPHRSRSPERQV